ncbi:EG45-like domain containing protein [Humulus lupulus]|uniref:EG45-like domain containing protein n=1 Tax=Humulus lupulus TaxID=3486 RepID=UPI002B40F739|nr:EG45-like domain containing protein [Humulus lupulus]
MMMSYNIYSRAFSCKFSLKPKKMRNKTWPRPRPLLFILIVLFVLHSNLHTVHGDVGTSAQYSPPYLPTACYDSDSSQFPSSNLFAAAGDGIWDNGASCGRQYQVRCISAAQPGTCIPDKTILIKIVDYAGSLVSSPSATGTTMVLSQTGFGAIADSTASSINIEFQQV